MKQFSMMFLFLALIVVLTGCKRWHIIPIKAGIYESSDLIEFRDLTFEKIRIEIIEISKDEFNNASNMDVIEDLATPSTERKYYSIKLYIKELGKDDVNYPITYVRSGGHDGIPEQYVFSFDFSYGNNINSVTLYIGLGRSSRLVVEMYDHEYISYGKIELRMVD